MLALGTFLLYIGNFSTSFTSKHNASFKNTSIFLVVPFDLDSPSYEA